MESRLSMSDEFREPFGRARVQRLVTQMAMLQRELNQIAPLPKAVLMTPERIKALEVAATALQLLAEMFGEKDDPMVAVLNAMIKEVEP